MKVTQKCVISCLVVCFMFSTIQTVSAEQNVETILKEVKRMTNHMDDERRKAQKLIHDSYIKRCLQTLEMNQKLKCYQVLDNTKPSCWNYVSKSKNARDACEKKYAAGCKRF